MKFPIGDDVRQVRGDQYEVKRCYALDLRDQNSSIAEVHTISGGPPYSNILDPLPMSTPIGVQVEPSGGLPKKETSQLDHASQQPSRDRSPLVHPMKAEPTSQDDPD